MSKEIYISDGMPQIDEERKMRLREFSKYVSVLPWFTIDVLHKLYYNIYIANSTIETKDDFKKRAITCADVLQSSFSRRIDSNVFILKHTLRDPLRIELQTSQAEYLKVGEFLLAYAQDCPHYCPSPKYKEVFTLEGNLIVNPDSVSGNISDHIARQMNQLPNHGEKVKRVEYYLNILNQQAGDSASGAELKNFMQRYKNYVEGKGMEGIPNVGNKEGKALTIRLPKQVKEEVMRELVVEEREPKLFVVLVGINEYKNVELQLKSSISDVERFEKYFDSFSTNVEVVKIVGAQATKPRIRKQMQLLGSTMQTDDTVLFYFSGYGGRKEFKKKKEPVLISYDDNSSQDGYSANELLTDLKSSTLQTKIILILDVDFGSRNTQSIFNNEFSFIPQIEIYGTPVLKRSPIRSGEKIITLEATGKAAKKGRFTEGMFSSILLDVLNSMKRNISFEEISKTVVEKTQQSQPIIILTSNNRALFRSKFLDGHMVDPIEERIAAVKNGTTGHLDLSNLGITKVPEELFDLEQLEELDLSWNPIETINFPEEKLPKLKVLTIGDCQLRDLDGILMGRRLINLIAFGAPNNKIDLIDPAWFSGMDRSLKIMIDGNPIVNVSEKNRSEYYLEYREHFALIKESVDASTLEILWFDLLKGTPKRMKESFEDIDRNEVFRAELTNTYIDKVKNEEALFNRFHKCSHWPCVINLFQNETEKDPFGLAKMGEELLCRMLTMNFAPEEVKLIILPDQHQSLIQALLDLEFPAIIGLAQKGRTGKSKAAKFVQLFYEHLLKGETIHQAYELTKEQVPDIDHSKKRNTFRTEIYLNETETRDWTLVEPNVDIAEGSEKIQQQQQQQQQQQNVPPEFELNIPPLSWPDFQIYINDIDGQEVLDHELNGFRFPIDGVLSHKKPGARCWLNLYNNSYYFSLPEQPYQPITRPIDLGGEDEGLNDQLVEVSNRVCQFWRIIILHHANSLASSPLTIEIGGEKGLSTADRNKWIQVHDKSVLNFDERLDVFQRVIRNSGLKDEFYFNIRVTNDSEEPLHFAAYMFMTNMRISSEDMWGASKYLEPGESRLLFGIDGSLLILDHHNIDYRWEEESIFVKFFVGKNAFDTKQWDQDNCWEHSRSSNRKGIPEEMIDGLFFTQQIELSMINEVRNNVDLEIQDANFEKYLEGPIMAMLRPVVGSRQEFKIHLIERKFEVQRKRNPRATPFFVMGYSMFSVDCAHPRILHEMQKIRPIYTQYYASLNDYMEGAVKQMGNSIKRFGIDNLMIFDLPDHILQEINILSQRDFDTSAVISTIGSLAEEIRVKYINIFETFNYLSISVVGMDRFTAGQIKMILKEFPAIKGVKVDTAMVRQVNEFLDTLNNILQELSREFNHVNYIDIRGQIKPNDLDTPWTLGQQNANQYAQFLLQQLDAAEDMERFAT